jgi:TetR/AcrR family transcriptional regulator, lmrAB and yxaGH operons repressor
MPAALLSRDEVVARVLSVVRSQGYDGASLAELSKATGLGKSSLYHHFPDGKDDMVAAVLDYLEQTLDANVFAPLRAQGTPLARLQHMNVALDEFYARGREACLLASLGIGDSSKPFHPRVRHIFQRWLDAITVVLRDAGMSRAAAKGRAEEALVLIEGALVLARSLGDAGIFSRTLKSLPDRLLAP